MVKNLKRIVRMSATIAALNGTLEASAPRKQVAGYGAEHVLRQHQLQGGTVERYAEPARIRCEHFYDCVLLNESPQGIGVKICDFSLGSYEQERLIARHILGGRPRPHELNLDSSESAPGPANWVYATLPGSIQRVRLDVFNVVAVPPNSPAQGGSEAGMAMAGSRTASTAVGTPAPSVSSNAVSQPMMLPSSSSSQSLQSVQYVGSIYLDASALGNIFNISFRSGPKPLVAVYSRAHTLGGGCKPKHTVMVYPLINWRDPETIAVVRCPVSGQTAGGSQGKCT